MLTVKHEGPSGAQFWETEHVQYLAPSRDNEPHEEQVMFKPYGADYFESITLGSIYIMNAGGKTVQQYHFHENGPVGMAA